MKEFFSAISAMGCGLVVAVGCNLAWVAALIYLFFYIGKHMGAF